MTYTTTPLETINTAASHSGLYIFGGVFAFLMFIAIFLSIFEKNREDSQLSTVCAVVCGIVICIISYFSFTTGEYKVFKNEQIIATRLSFDEVSDVENVGSSKHKRYEEVIRGFVYYKVPEGTVMFRAEPGVVYPKTAILYRN